MRSLAAVTTSLVSMSLIPSGELKEFFYGCLRVHLLVSMSLIPSGELKALGFGDSGTNFSVYQ